MSFFVVYNTIRAISHGSDCAMPCNDPLFGHDGWYLSIRSECENFFPMMTKHPTFVLIGRRIADNGYP